MIFKSNSITAGINNKECAIVFSVYKNLNGQISVNCPNGITGQATATVYSVAGQKLESKSIVSAKTLFRETYNSGVYLVSIISNGNSTTQKVIIN